MSLKQYILEFRSLDPQCLGRVVASCVQACSLDEAVAMACDAVHQESLPDLRIVAVRPPVWSHE